MSPVAMDDRLTIALDRKDELAVVRPAGRVIRDNQDKLRSFIEDLVGEGVYKIALDLSQVDYMDSAGLGCCSYAHKLIVQRTAPPSEPGAVAAFGASDGIYKTWTMIRLDLVIPVFANETEALNWLRNSN